MILQKSARFLMICLCAIIFHGNVFGDDIDFNCDKYVLTIPGEENAMGEIVGELNICVSKDDSSMACNDTEKSCICKNGYETVDDLDNPCQKCDEYFYSNQTYTGGKCEQCNGIIETTKDGRNAGCTECGVGEKPNSEHTSCVCKDGYFLDSTKTKCVQSCEGAGIGLFTENGESQCVKCSDHGQSAKQDDTYGNVCTNECGGYLVDKNGTCGYCDKGMYYKADNHSCVSTCSNSYDFIVATTPIQVCCSVNEHFNTASGQCESCAKNEWFNESCQTCPKNFSCDGNTKTKCPFGEVSDEGKGVCEVPDITKKGFLYKDGAEYKVITEDLKNGYLNSTDETYLSNFEYAGCDNVNGFSETGKFKVNGQYVDVQICHECDKNTRRPVGSACVCGERGTEPQAGLVGGFGEHENVCQICPNGVDKGNGMGDYTCDKCEKGTSLYWNGTEYECLSDCPEGTALYTDENGYGWCLTHKELKNVITEAEANRYYKNNGKWELCPAGYCCLGGDKSECNRGTFSLYKGGLACQNEAGICLSCGGKTTKDKATYCQQQDKEEDWCRKEMCTESITPTTFCIGEYKNYNENMCFNIDNIKMTLASGVYNTKDVTGDDTDQ